MQETCPICSKGKEKICNTCFEGFERINSELKIKYVDHLLVPFSYSGILKEIMLKFKFNGEYSWGKFLGEILYREFIKKGYRPDDFDIITYIPSDVIRFFKRGFNQAEIIGKNFSRLSGIPIKSTLYRTRIEKESHRVKGVERKKIRHSFNAKSSKLRGVKKIIIIDDIVTTGQTLSEAAKRIKLEEDIEVWAICLLGDCV